MSLLAAVSLVVATFGDDSIDMATTDLFWSTEMDTDSPTPAPTEEPDCNGFPVTLFDLLTLTSPTDVCAVIVTETTEESYIYSCDNKQYQYYESADCTGNYTVYDPGMSATCSVDDCDYGIAKVYENSTDDDCNEDVYTEAAFTMGCTVMANPPVVVALNLYCASDTLNGGDISADLYFGPQCAGTPTQQFDKIDDAFTTFSTFGFNVDPTCMELKCYQAGFDRSNTDSPTPAPTPSSDEGNSSVQLTVGIMSSILVAFGIGLMQ